VMCSRPGNWESTTWTTLNASISTVPDASQRAPAPFRRKQSDCLIALRSA
jgi:hypothetical protein